MADGVNFGLLFGMSPPDIVKYFEGKGLVMTGAWTEHWQEAHAKGFTVANVLRKDVLQDIHGAVTDLLVHGKNPDEIKAALIETLQKKGWYGKGIVADSDGVYQGKKLTAGRIDTILDTNRASAYSAARWRQAWAVRELKPYIRYNHNGAERPRPMHLAMNGWVFPIDDPFWKTHWPVNAWRCHCDTSSLSMRDVERYGIGGNLRTTGDGDFSTDEVVLPNGTRAQVTTYTDKKSGLKITTSPGFNFNAGRAHYQPTLDKYEPRVARAYIAGALRGDDFKFVHTKVEQLVNDNAAMQLDDLRRLAGDTKFPVAMLAPEMREAIGALTGVVLLSEDTMVKQVVKRTGQDFGFEEYWRVQSVLENAQLIVREGGLHLSFFEQDGMWYQAVVKATRDGRELYLQSFHRTESRKMDAFIKRGEVLLDVRADKK